MAASRRQGTPGEPSVAGNAPSKMRWARRGASGFREQAARFRVTVPTDGYTALVPETQFTPLCATVPGNLRVRCCLPYPTASSPYLVEAFTADIA